MLINSIIMYTLFVMFISFFAGANLAVIFKDWQYLKRIDNINSLGFISGVISMIVILFSIF